MATDRFVSETLASKPDLERELNASGSTLLDTVREMSPMAFVLLAAKGAPGAAASAPSDPILGRGLEELVDRAAREQGFSPEEAREALTLLANGTVERDLGSVVAQTSQAIGRIPAAALGSIQRTLSNPFRVLGLTFAIARDLAELPIEAPGLGRREFDRMMRGGTAGPGREFPLFDHTFDHLYRIEPIAVLRDWLLEVTGRESVQLALIVYARTQGIELQREDIEAARQALRDGDLTPAVLRGIDYFRREHAGQFPEILQTLG
jgi:hypothetical protein